MKIVVALLLVFAIASAIEIDNNKFDGFFKSWCVDMCKMCDKKIKIQNDPIDFGWCSLKCWMCQPKRGNSVPPKGTSVPTENRTPTTTYTPGEVPTTNSNSTSTSKEQENPSNGTTK